MKTYSQLSRKTQLEFESAALIIVLVDGTSHRGIAATSGLTHAVPDTALVRMNPTQPDAGNGHRGRGDE
jgi:hypothetical protein